MRIECHFPGWDIMEAGTWAEGGVHPRETLYMNWLNWLNDETDAFCDDDLYLGEPVYILTILEDAEEAE